MKEVGLGKTLQTISLLLAVKEHHAPKQPNLIVVPSSSTFVLLVASAANSFLAVDQWIAEVLKWAPSLRVECVQSLECMCILMYRKYSGSREKRKKKQKQLEKKRYDVGCHTMYERWLYLISDLDYFIRPPAAEG